MKTLYTVKRCKKDGTLYGPSHGSDNGYTTLCDQEIVANTWWITNNTFTGEITCKKCNQLLKEKPTLQDRFKRYGSYPINGLNR